MENIKCHDSLKESLDQHSKEINHRPFKFHSINYYEPRLLESWGYIVLDYVAETSCMNWWNHTYWIKKKEDEVNVRN